eukprot:SAG11_NODE_5829_length_1454_cov_1.307011_3_plen_167_part_00
MVRLVNVARGKKAWYKAVQDICRGRGCASAGVDIASENVAFADSFATAAGAARGAPAASAPRLARWRIHPYALDLRLHMESQRPSVYSVYIRLCRVQGTGQHGYIRLCSMSSIQDASGCVGAAERRTEECLTRFRVSGGCSALPAQARQGRGRGRRGGRGRERRRE